jgi:hypothetical protein
VKTEGLPEDACTSERVALAADMRVKGFTWAQIALELGTDGNVIQVETSRVIQKAASEWDAANKSYVLALIMGRLDYMFSKLMPAIDMGDVKSIDSAIRITAQQAKLLRLEHADTGSAPKTIIIRGTEAEYVAGLKLVGGIDD